MRVTFGSVCSGIEAASVALTPLGWEAAWFAEIEPFPCAVLAHHYPEVVNLGDMTGVAAKVLKGEVAAPDVLIGGTPCQSFSVAGLRAGLADARGQLTYSFVEAANAIDSARHVRGDGPCVVWWENVPGVLSSKDNAFGCFLGALAGEECEMQPPRGKWTDAGYVRGPQRAVAWRVLDAQYFGLAQRRRRVFVVASAREGFDPCEVLFEFEGVRRDFAPRRETGQEPAGTLKGRPSSGGASDRPDGTDAAYFLMGGIDYENNPHEPTEPTGPLLKGSPTGGGRPLPAICMATVREVAPCLTANYGKQPDSSDTSSGPMLVVDAVAFAQNQLGEVRTGEVAGTLNTNSNASGRNTPMVVQSYGIQANIIGRQHHNGGNGMGFSEECAPTLTKADQHGVACSVNVLQGAEPVEIAAFKAGQGSKAGGIGYDCNVSPTLSAADSGSNRTPTLMQGMQVRRLTPVECERLQGFPDGWTLVPFKGKPATDGHRYRALGNSMAVPVIRWIGQRLDGFLTQQEEL